MKPMTFEERLLNMNEKNRRVDNFYVTFYGIPENIANILGRQVKSITRPTINYEVENTRHRGNTYKDKQKLTFEPVTLAVYDDENSVTSTFVYVQLFRQQGKYTDKFGQMGLDRNYRFDIKVEVFNSSNQAVEGYYLRDCFVQNVDHSDPVIASADECEIILSIEYDNLDILIFDEYISMKGE